MGLGSPFSFCRLAAIAAIAATTWAFDFQTPDSMRGASAASFSVCHGFGCAFRTEVSLTRADRAALHNAMRGARGNADRERRAIARAVQVFETRIGARVGFMSDRAKNLDPRLDDPTQLDCIDEASNTDALLRYLASEGLLRHHTVGPWARRGFIISAHNAARIIDKDTGRAYAVDSWPRANGQRPDILPLDDWRRGQEASQ